MSEKINKNKIDNQAQFCVELSRRIAEDLADADVSYSYVRNYTVTQNDIVRLRRELSKLFKIIGGE